MEMTFSTSWGLGKEGVRGNIFKVLNECPKWEPWLLKRDLFCGVFSTYGSVALPPEKPRLTGPLSDQGWSVMSSSQTAPTPAPPPLSPGVHKVPPPCDSQHCPESSLPHLSFRKYIRSMWHAPSTILGNRDRTGVKRDQKPLLWGLVPLKGPNRLMSNTENVRRCQSWLKNTVTTYKLSCFSIKFCNLRYQVFFKKYSHTHKKSIHKNTFAVRTTCPWLQTSIYNLTPPSTSLEEFAQGHFRCCLLGLKS